MSLDLVERSTGLSLAWHALAIPSVQERLSTHSEVCPTKKDSSDSPGTVPTRSRSPLVVVLIAAGLVTTALGEYADAAVIGAVVVLNAIVGFFQERQAERSVRAPLRLVSPQAHVVRDHEDWEIDSRGLVPGDVVLLESGRAYLPICV